MYINFNKLKTKYVSDNNGYIIMGSPGIGKSYFSKTHYKNNKKITISSDILIKHTSGKVFSIEEWIKNYNNKITTYSNILKKTKQNGFKILSHPGFYNLIPDAIVILPWTTYKQYLQNRPDIQMSHVRLNIIKLRKLSTDHNIKIFSSIQDAVNYCENRSKNTISNIEYILLVIMIVLIVKLYKN